MEERAQQVISYLNTRERELIDFTRDLIATPSINPPGNEREVASLIARKLAELGMPEAQIVAAEPTRPNLICRVPGTHGTPRLLLNGHIDTKPVSDEDYKNWNTEPLTPTTVNDHLYGLGSTDMKGGIAALIFAAAAVAHVSPTVSGDIILALVADEEAGRGLGARYLVENWDLTADFGLVAEPCGITEDFEYLPLFCRGTYYFRVRVYGTQMHSSVSDLLPSVNASVKMGWAMWRLSKDLNLSFNPHPYYPQGPTVTPGVMVEGGVYLGIHPGYAEFTSDIRLLPGMSPDQVTADLTEFFDGLQSEDEEFRYQLETLGSSTQGTLIGDEPFVQQLKSAAEQVLGREVRFGGFPAYCDAYWFHKVAGIPTVAGFGPGLLPLAHGPNEYVSVTAIHQASKIYALAALGYLS